MSYYSYKKKIFVETSKGDIFPLAFYADSSIRDEDRKMIWKWMLYALKQGSVLCPKEEFKKLAKDAVEKQKKEIRECEFREHDGDVAGDDYLYSGNVYLGGRRIKDYQRFLSVRSTVPVDVFFRTHGGIHVDCKAYDQKWKLVKEDGLNAMNEDDLYRLQQMSEDLAREYPECTICHSVWSFCG